MTNNKLRIAIDGGAATGKSTVSRMIAEKLSLNYINTGQMYRLFAFFALKNNLLNDEEQLVNELRKMNYWYEGGFIKVDNFEFKPDDLESVDVTKNASLVATMKLIREFASELQIKLGKENGVLLEGRDIGTFIMPDADFKFFLVVKPEVAAERRLKHFKSIGVETSYEDVLNKIIERNINDSTREVAPLIPAETSIIIDTSAHSAEEIADKIIEVINNG